MRNGFFFLEFLFEMFLKRKIYNFKNCFYISVFGCILNRNFGQNRKFEVNRNRNRNRNQYQNRNQKFPITKIDTCWNNYEVFVLLLYVINKLKKICVDIFFCKINNSSKIFEEFIKITSSTCLNDVWIIHQHYYLLKVWRQTPPTKHSKRMTKS